jgi:hypothetical protein
VDPSNLGNCGSSCAPCTSGQICTADSSDPAGFSCQTCPSGQTACNGQCVDLNSPTSCGTSTSPGQCSIQQCAAPAGGTATCNNGQCGQTCPSGQEPFNNQCVPVCPSGTTRDPTTGQCSNCPAGQMSCNGQCVDSSDNAHCGACNAPCGFTQVCQADSSAASGFSCQSCPSGQFLDSSGTSCVSSCGPGEVPGQFFGPGGVPYTQCFACSSRYPGSTVCGNTCSFLNDAANCGSCGNACPSTSSGNGICVNGACSLDCYLDPITGDALHACGSPPVCVDLDRDPNNCGVCGNVCSPGLTCTALYGGVSHFSPGCVDCSLEPPGNCGG